jgi:hypothetical protein
VDPSISLNGIQMRVVSTAQNGVVNAETLFTFRQDDAAVSAHYAGGKVRMGYLVGILSPEELRFRYAQLDTEGNLEGGYSTCEISRTPEGRIRLLEHFQWESREGSGTNIFEEVLANSKPGADRPSD